MELLGGVDVLSYICYIQQYSAYDFHCVYYPIFCAIIMYDLRLM